MLVAFAILSSCGLLFVLPYSIHRAASRPANGELQTLQRLEKKRRVLQRRVQRTVELHRQEKLTF